MSGRSPRAGTARRSRDHTRNGNAPRHGRSRPLVVSGSRSPGESPWRLRVRRSADGHSRHTLAGGDGPPDQGACGEASRQEHRVACPGSEPVSRHSPGPACEPRVRPLGAHADQHDHATAERRSSPNHDPTGPSGRRSPPATRRSTPPAQQRSPATRRPAPPVTARLTSYEHPRAPWRITTTHRANQPTS